MSKRLRAFIIILFIVLAGVSLYPSLQWYLLLDDETRGIVSSARIVMRDNARSQAREDLTELREIAQEDPQKLLPDEYSFMIAFARGNYRRDGIDIPSSWDVESILDSFVSQNDAYIQLEDYYFEKLNTLKESKSRIIQPGLDLFGGVRVILEANKDSLTERLDRTPSQQDIDDALEVAVEVLTSRIDTFGVSEPQIRIQDNSQISIEIPGDNDPERIQTFLSGKGNLNLHLVDETATQLLFEEQQNNPGWDLAVDGIPEYVPAGSKIAPYVTKDRYGIENRVRWIAIYEDVVEKGLDGAYIIEARADQDQLTGRPLVRFTLDGRGSEFFARLTRENVNQSLAIVLDGDVRAYAQISGEIPNGQGAINGFTPDESRNIALVLRTAALPVQLDVLTQQSVGSFIGRDVIQAGIRAVSLGFALVFLFMIIYYKGSGFIADIALILNLFFLFAILSVFNLTLTLTSIAAIVLTVGMSVDANVIIFERIKEEYRTGKTVRSSIRTGFQKAFWTIMDANITTFIAALFLSQVATGPVQGFAVTLAVGIVTSMFCALFVSRLIYDFGSETLKWSRLSIQWRGSKK